MKIVVVDLYGDYGHFKVPYTTTSPLTFPVPPKSALMGMIGAVFGYDKTEYLHRLAQHEWRCAIQLLKPVKKMHISENLLHTKNVRHFARMDPHKAPHSPTRIEFLKDAAYRIFVHCSDQHELERLSHALETRTHVYTLSLGLSECLLNYQWRGMADGVEVTGGGQWIPLHSILPLNRISSREDIALFNPTSRFQRVHLPVELSPDRILLSSEFFLIETNGGAIEARNLNYYQLQLGQQPLNIVLF